MIEALQGMLTAARLEETVDGLQVEVAGMGGMAVQHILIGFGGEAPDGKLHVWFDIGLDGLNAPTLPPKIAAYLPQHVEMRPSLSGVQTADLAKLATDATEDGRGRSSLSPISPRCSRMAALYSASKHCRSISARRRSRAPAMSPCCRRTPGMARHI